MMTTSVLKRLRWLLVVMSGSLFAAVPASASTPAELENAPPPAATDAAPVGSAVRAGSGASGGAVTVPDSLPLKPAGTALAGPAAYPSGGGGTGTSTEELSQLRETLAQQSKLLQDLLAREAAAKVPAGGDAGVAAPAAASVATPGPVSAPPVPVAAPPVGVEQVHVGERPGETTPAAAPQPATPAEPADGFASEADRRAYASGVSLGHELQQSLAQQRSVGLSLSPALILSGLEDSYGGRPLRLTDDALRKVLQGLSDDFNGRMRERRDEEVSAGRDFRTKFRKQKGVVSDAGSLYLITKKGFGRLRTADMVTLQITGHLPDGTVFDDSGDAGQTRKVKVGAMLPAIAIGLQKVGVGGQLTVVVPPEKGYGDMGLPPAVPGGATLIFDITVKGVNDAG
ncbi:FKBP-type peptidyl-prolyl cis-trans isomerase [Enterobacter asburiae]|uniref:FKBP-type peptidyl-prolyl cis-trans isomerase n=1 Tax=Enterobacter asburiae TaxID=61645 RepID=UPI0021D344FF|nr:FKBP-type peptidyl-prolyl cis-trans isomerase [Enterobacter asburiae]MCU6244090.1 FKBP-type peptidyl-prolyl cis-trans isomerase [Enterobacter asburiae]